MIGQILTGAVGGICYSLSGLANKEKRESFDWGKMAPTVILAAVIGGVAGFTGQDYGIVANMGFAAGLTVVIEKFWKSIYHKFILKDKK